MLKLVEEDKLALQDTLKTYYPAVPEDKKGITIHQLLSHTSGLPVNLSNHQLYDIVPHEEYHTKAFSEKLVADPGEKSEEPVSSVDLKPITRFSNSTCAITARVRIRGR